MTDDSSVSTAERLNHLLASAGLDSLDSVTSARFEGYCALLLRWNARMNLTAIRDVEGILSRHFVESIACARALPKGIATLLDFGSGAGFPGIPIALCRAEIAVTLAESQGKKSAFLREAVRALGIPAIVHSGRAEILMSQFDCVTLRAVDRMGQAVETAAKLVATNGWLALMTTVAEFAELQSKIGTGWVWRDRISPPGSEARVLALGRKDALEGREHTTIS